MLFFFSKLKKSNITSDNDAISSLMRVLSALFEEKKMENKEGSEPPCSRTLSERSTTYTIDEVRDRERDRKKSIL